MAALVNSGNFMIDVLVDAIIDSLKLFPFLFLTYVLIELLEHKTSLSKGGVLRGNFAPLLGALVGIVPQCGFSVTAAKLYDRRIIRTGTILAVFIATSDEAIVILISNGVKALSVLPLIALKFLLAVIVGYVANALTKSEKLASCEEHVVCCDDDCAGCSHVGEGAVGTYILSPLYHSLKIFFFIFVVNFIFGIIIFFVGEEKIANFLGYSAMFQPFLTALVGLIPNCASSVILTQTYILGGISFGGLFAGLCSNAGLGLVILFKNPKNIKKTLALVAVLYVVGVVSGLLIDLCVKILI